MLSGRSLLKIIVPICTLILLIALSQNISIDSRALDLQCKSKLNRLAIAVNQFVVDSGHQRFPPIHNPTQGQAWMPNQANSIDAVLWQYLQGDMTNNITKRQGESADEFAKRLEANSNLARPKVGTHQRADESTEEYYARLRRISFATDPSTGLPFWYNDRLRSMDPRDLLTGQRDTLWYFTCQRTIEGKWPYSQDGELGVYTALGKVHVEYISIEQIDQYERDIQEYAISFPKQKPGESREKAQQRHQQELASMRAELHDLRRGQDNLKRDPQQEVPFVPRYLLTQTVEFEVR